MANRGQPSSPPNSAALDSAAAAFVRVSLSDSPGPAGTPRAHSYPNTARGRGGSLAGKRVKPNFKLSDINGSNGVPSVGGGAAGAGLGAGRPNLAGPAVPRRPPSNIGSPFSNFGKIVDPSGVLNFSGKAVLHASGVDFSNGSSFAINMEQLQLDEELGKGNYGTVKKVLHRPTNVAMAMKVGTGEAPFFPDRLTHCTGNPAGVRRNETKWNNNGTRYSSSSRSPGDCRVLWGVLH